MAGCGALWWVLPYRPRAAWATEAPAVVHGFIPGTAVVLTSSPWSGTIDGAPGPMLGPLVARDAATGTAHEWLPDNERLTLVEPGPDGRNVVIGRVIGGRARLFLHDASNGKVIVELPRDGPRAGNENDVPPDANEQFAAFRPDGRRIVYADRVDDERWLRVWDVETSQEIASLPDAGPPAAWSPDGQSLAYAAQVGQAGAVRLLEDQTGHSRGLGSSLLENRRPVQICFSPDGQSVVSLLQSVGPAAERRPPDEDEIAGWNAASGRQTYRRSIRRAVFLANVPWFVTQEWADATTGACIHRCDYATGAEQDHFELKDIADTMWVGLSPDGVLVLGYDYINDPVFEFLDLHFLQGALGTNVRPVLWETGTGRRRHVLPMAIDSDLRSPTGYAWSPDGTLLAIAGEDDLMVWDIPPRKPLKWFMAGAALFALPPFLIARWRVRRLRKEAAA